MNTKFLLFADLHVDMMHDGAARAAYMAEEARAFGAEFAVQLGDLMYPDTATLEKADPKCMDMVRSVRPWALDRDDERRSVYQAFEEAKLPLYSVLGNHDMHVCDKETACAWFGMPAPVYSVVLGGIRFVMLDTNFMMTENGLVDMAYGNSAGIANHLLRFVPEKQLQWLEETVMASEEVCVLCSHAPLMEKRSGIQNRQAVLDVIKRCNKDKKRIVLSLNGHSHVDGMSVHGGVPFVSINSASYHWMGADYECIRYSEKMSRTYPRLKRTAPYMGALYALVEAKDGEIKIHGMKSRFVGKTPDELGLPREENDFPTTAEIASHVITW